MHALRVNNDYYTVADPGPGGIPGSHGSPLSAQFSSRSVCTMRNFSLDGSPQQQNYSDCSSQVFMNEFWSIACPRAQQTTQNTPFSIASGRGHHKSGRGIKNLRAFFILGTPLPKFLDPPLLHNVIYMPLLEHGVNY